MVSEVKAIYMGQNGTGYKVNVRNAHPQGMIGDAGVIRTFKTEKEAKDYAKTVNATGVDTFVPQKDEIVNLNPVRHAGDEFVASKTGNKDVKPPTNNVAVKSSVTLNEQGNEVTIKDAIGMPGTVVLYGPAEEGRSYVEGTYNGQPVKMSQGEVIRLLLAASAQDAYKHFAG